MAAEITPDDITPDEKDWTWVLESVCPECGFDVRALRPTAVGAMIRENAARWAEVLVGDPTTLAIRTRPDRWSTLEYAEHVRDVHRLYLERLDLMLTLDGPHYPNWDQDAAAADWLDIQRWAARS